MTITPNLLTRWAGLAAVAAGAIFIGVQINHPQLDATSIQTTEVVVRDTLKVVMAALALVGITGMYLNQVRKHGLLGLIGYVVFAAGYLGIMCVTFAAAYVLPEVATSNPGFVNDVIAVNTGRGTVHGDIGALADGAQGARASPTWSAACSSASRCTAPASCPAGPPPSSPSAASLPPPSSVMPDAFYRFLAFPNGIAMIALGYSLWQVARDRRRDPVDRRRHPTCPATAGVE